MHQELSDRERRVLAAVIQSYVATAEPAGSRTIARKFGLNVSPATIRNTMSDLEEKGFLFHPHTSAGRIPTHEAYRLYVDSLIHVADPTPAERERLTEQLAGAAAGQAGVGELGDDVACDLAPKRPTRFARAVAGRPVEVASCNTRLTAKAGFNAFEQRLQRAAEACRLVDMN